MNVMARNSRKTRVVEKRAPEGLSMMSLKIFFTVTVASVYCITLFLGGSWKVPLVDVARKSTQWIVEIPDLLDSLWTGSSPQHDAVIKLQSMDIQDKDACLERFLNALKIPTHVSKQGEQIFEQFHAQLKKDFPLVFSKVQVEKFLQYSLMFTWKGTSKDLDPIVLISHFDVVPANAGNWTYPPFSGTVADDYVWSRGTLDTKFTAISIIEAINQLLMKGVFPKRTVIVTIGHDEEVGGFGARAMAEELKSKNIRPSLVLDEGGFVVMDNADSLRRLGLHSPFAFVGTGEKVAMNWKITVKGSGGHASLPDTGSGKTVASRLAAIVSTLERNPMPTKLESPATDMVKSIGESLTFWPAAWLLKHVDNAIINPIVGQILGSKGGKALGALVRSTAGIVNLQAGQGAGNVLPQDGSIEVNIRTLPSDSRSFVKDYLHTVTKPFKDDVTIEDISVQYPDGTVTPADSPQFNLVKQVIQNVLSHRTLSESPQEGETGVHVNAMPVHPLLLTGMTDSRWFHEIAPQKIIRFSPFSLRIGRNDLAMIHGVDEKVSVHEYFDAIRFFSHIIDYACLAEDQTWATQQSA